MQSTPNLTEDIVSIETKWLKALWKAAECEWYDDYDPEKFLSKWICLHSILSSCYRLFRPVNGTAVKQNLQNIENECNHSKTVFNYHKSVFTLTTEDICQQIKNLS